MLKILSTHYSFVCTKIILTHIYYLISLTLSKKHWIRVNMIVAFFSIFKNFINIKHNISLRKPKHYGIRGVAYCWFESYLKDRKQYVSINGYNSKHLPIPFGVQQGFFLGPLSFLIYVNDLITAIKHCKLYHFDEETNLLHINDSIKKLNKAANSDLNNLTNWLNTNKISLNVSKTNEY